MKFNDYFDEEITFIFNKYSRDEIFINMAGQLEKNDYVKKTFKEALLEREETFPTGLLVGNYGVAIPHTDSIHIKKPFISVAVLKEPSIFYQMDNKEETVEVRIIFMLGVSNPTEQVDILQNIIALIQDESMVNNIIQSNSNIKILSIIETFFNKTRI